MNRPLSATRHSRIGAWTGGWLPLLFLCLVWAGKRFIGERWWLTTWLVYLPQALFLIPSLLAACVYVLLQRWWKAAGQIAAAALGVALLCSGEYRLPAPVRRGDLRVMTWNVMGLGGDPDGVLAVVRREQPDVLLLQEAKQARGPDPVPWLTDRLPGWKAVRGGDVAILSPHPLGPPHSQVLGPRDTTRVALWTTVAVRGRPIVALTVHFNTGLPGPPYERAWTHPRHNMAVAAAVRAEQASHLAGIVEKIGGPLIVGGDFNSPPDSRACWAISPPLVSAFAAAGAGFGWSFPSTHPLLRIDHLFLSRDLDPLGCRVLSSLASDHRPLVADLAWRAR